MSGPGGAGAPDPDGDLGGDLRDDLRDDRALLRAHVDGDHEAFGVLFARHRDRLWAVALRTMGNPEDAADGLQDAMVSAFRRAGSYRGDAAVTTWLHRVVVNACLDRIRAAGVRRADPLPDDLEEYAARGAVVSDPGGGLGARGGPGGSGDVGDSGDPADVVVRRDQRAMILAGLAQLPPDQRAALVLVDMEGLSIAEAAEVLECAEGTVKSRCSRGRRRLAGLLDLGSRPTVGSRPAAPGNRTPPGHVPSPGHAPSPGAAAVPLAAKELDAKEPPAPPDPAQEVES